jgi:hypothetical protein
MAAREAKIRTNRNNSKPSRCYRKFLRFFPDGFRDETYIDWERAYKWEAHLRFSDLLNEKSYAALLRAGKYNEIAMHAVRVESRTNLLFSFEKMALRDAVALRKGAKLFAEGLYEFLYGDEEEKRRFNQWRDIVAELPRKQTRVLTWPVLTVFGFIGDPIKHLFLKPNVTRLAAKAYGFDFQYSSRPAWETYLSLLEFGAAIRRDLKVMKPRDMIDIQSFIWVQGSDEYEE